MLKGNLIKIAVVDDDQDDYLIISDYIKAIEDTNLQVDWCKDYQTAIEKIKQKHYDLYLVDYRLGNQTGLDLLEESNAIGSDAPIVLLTGKGNRTIDIKAMQSGATDYLVKADLTTEKLERCIRYSLDRAESLKELKARESKYRNLFEGSKDSVIIADEKLNIIELNEAASLLLGSNKEALIGHSLFEFIKDDTQKKEVCESLSKRKSISDAEIQIQSKNEIMSCILSISVYSDTEDRPLVHAIIHDITHIKKAEIANLQAQKLAANERLMRTLAHEIRNPLNNISLAIEQMLVPEENENDRDTLIAEIIKRNSIRINKIISELLNLTRPPELEFECNSLQEILDESIAMTTDRINLQNVKVKKDYANGAYMIQADKPKLIIAFTNILINAIEAMEANKGELMIAVNETKDNYSVCIRDNGFGIPAEYIPRLFEPFFTSKKNGTGLGLVASYSIIQSHKGSIQVESEVDKGSSFYITFNKS
jgi:PAS domain S-box-containing protein